MTDWDGGRTIAELRARVEELEAVVARVREIAAVWLVMDPRLVAKEGATAQEICAREIEAALPKEGT